MEKVYEPKSIALANSNTKLTIKPQSDISNSIASQDIE